MTASLNTEHIEANKQENWRIHLNILRMKPFRFLRYATCIGHYSLTSSSSTAHLNNKWKFKSTPILDHAGKLQINYQYFFLHPFQLTLSTINGHFKSTQILDIWTTIEGFHVRSYQANFASHHPATTMLVLSLYETV